MANGAQLASDFRNLKDDLRDNLSDASKGGLKETERTSKAIIRAKNIQYKGDLVRSHRIVPNEHGGHTLKIGGSQAPHAPFVEFGTGGKFKQYSGETNFGPYRAPSIGPNLIQNIEEWVDRKGITANHVRQQDLGYVIALSIARTGTSRQPFAQPSWFITEPKIRKEGRRAVKKSVKEM